jgi:sn-glycerol 3-phosphate transport system substrate-binding protein
MNLHRTVRIAAGAAMAASSLAIVSLVAPLGSTAASAATACSPSALPKAKTNITFWESMSSANETLIQSLVKQFNSSQTKVHVTDVNQSGGYVQTWDDYLTSLKGGAPPNVVMLDQYITQGAVDSHSIIPVSRCVAGTHYSTATFAKKTILEETVGGQLQGLPYSVSAPVLIYNKQAFALAKIKAPPATVEQMAADAKILKAAGAKAKDAKLPLTDGMTIKLDPWYLQVWQGVSDTYFVNNQNGRTARARAATFNDSTGLATFTQLQSIVKNHDAVTNPSTGSTAVAYSNLYQIGYGKSGMTIDTSATLGTILADLHLFKNVTLGVAPFPRLTTHVTGGVQPGGNALFIPAKPNTSAAKLAASWEFIQYLDSAVNMATWDVGTGYVPIRTDAARESSMVAFWKKYPSLKAAYTEIMSGKVDNATAGPLLGDYYTVNNNLATYMNDLLSSPFNASNSPATVLSNASKAVTKDIQTYNSSL